MTEIHGFYPVQVCESRYGGTYSGGRWVVMAGHYNPRDTAAFGSDVDCMKFWQRVDAEGPVIELSGPRGPKKVYVASGNDVKALIDDARDHIRKNSSYEHRCLHCDNEYEGDWPWSSCTECGNEPISGPRSTNYDDS